MVCRSAPAPSARRSIRSRRLSAGGSSPPSSSRAGVGSSIPVPPPGYGGIEQVVALLAAELTERGNEVALFAAPGTESQAEVLSPLETPHPDEIEMSLYEVDHVASAFARI